MPSAAVEDGLAIFSDQAYHSLIGRRRVDQSRRHHIQDLISRFTVQLQYGCGDPLCTTPTCASTKSTVLSRPVRKYTALSARAIAIVLAASEDAESRLCPHVLANFASSSATPQSKVDPKSVIQQLCNTFAFRRVSMPVRSKPGEPSSSFDDQKTQVPLPGLSDDAPLTCHSMAFFKSYITNTKPSDEISPGRCTANVLAILHRLSYSLSDFLILYRSFSDSPTCIRQDTAGSHANNPTVLLDYVFRYWTSTPQDIIFNSIWTALQPIFESPFKHPPSPKSFLTLPIREKNSRVVAVVFTAIHALTASVPKTDRGTWHMVWSIIVNGRAYGKQNFKKDDPHVSPWLRILDAFEHEPALRMAKCLIRAIGARTCLEETLMACGNGKVSEPEMKGWEVTGNMRIKRQIVLKLAHEEQTVRMAKFKTTTREEDRDGNHMIGTTSMVWLEWLRRCFLKEWDGSYTINRWSVAGQALELMEDLWLNRARNALDIPDDLFPTPIVLNHIDVDKAVQNWLAYKNNVNTRHLLSFKCLFSTRALTLFVRTSQYILMRRAYSEADYFWQMRRRNLYQISYEDSVYLDRRLKAAQEHYLVLRINRRSLLSDAFDQLWHREKRELMRPLRVRMGFEEGEIGHDHGGVQIEFFKLACQEAFKPEYSMFVIDPETRLAWFQPASLVPLYKFQIFGLLFALAIWNGVTLPVSFPLAFYKKLLFTSCNQSDLFEGWPSLTRSLAQLRKHEGSVEEDFARDYVYSFTANGLHVDVDMADPWDGWSIWDKIKSGKGLTAGRMKVMRAYPDKYHPDRPAEPIDAQTGTFTAPDHSDLQEKIPETIDADPKPRESDTTDRNPKDGNSNKRIHIELDPDPKKLHWPGWDARIVEGEEEPVPVTNENRQKYIQCYAGWVMDFSIRPQFMAFAKGFYSLMVHKSLTLMSPEQLRTLIEGHNHLDINALQKATTYQQYTASSPVILWFWEVVKSYPQEKQKQLLEFVTASSRVPVNGAESLTFVIEKTGNSDTQALPGSSTCFGTLRLPEYESKEILRKKLDIALEHSLGFGQA